VFCCAWCCAELHKVDSSTYVKTESKEKDGQVTAVHKPTSYFRNQRVQTMGRAQTDKHAMRIAKFCDERMQRKFDADLDDNVTSFSALRLYREMRASAMLKSALDWITPLGAFLWILFACGFCGLAPNMSNCWYRFAKPGYEEDSENYWGGEKFGYWRCACCGEHWTWGTGKRLVIIGTHSKKYGFKDYMLAHCDKTDDKQNNSINWLKGMKMMEALGDKTVTRENILCVINKLNVECDRKFTRGIEEVRQVESVNPYKQESRWTTSKLYCADERLSLRGAGYKFNAIDTNLYTDGLATLSKDSMDELLFTAASGLDVEEWNASTDAEKKFKREVLSHPAFLKGRVELRSRI
jgi:hypothetical protein